MLNATELFRERMKERKKERKKGRKKEQTYHILHEAHITRVPAHVFMAFNYRKSLYIDEFYRCKLLVIMSMSWLTSYMELLCTCCLCRDVWHNLTGNILGFALSLVLKGLHQSCKIGRSYIFLFFYLCCCCLFVLFLF